MPLRVDGAQSPDHLKISSFDGVEFLLALRSMVMAHKDVFFAVSIELFLINLMCREMKRYMRMGWEDFCVRDLMHLTCNETVLTDLVLLYSLHHRPPRPLLRHLLQTGLEEQPQAVASCPWAVRGE